MERGAEITASRGIWHQAALTLAPMIVLGTAWILWAISDALIWIGPLDLALAVSVAAVVASALSRAFLSADCQTAPLWAPTELVVRSIVVGAVAGAAYAVGGLLAIRSGPSWSLRRWIIGSGIGIGVGAAWLTAFVITMPFAMCARP